MDDSLQALVDTPSKPPPRSRESQNLGRQLHAGGRAHSSRPEIRRRDLRPTVVLAGPVLDRSPDRHPTVQVDTPKSVIKCRSHGPKSTSPSMPSKSCERPERWVLSNLRLHRCLHQLPANRVKSWPAWAQTLNKLRQSLATPEKQKASKNVAFFEASQKGQRSDSNRQPPVYKTGALPIELCWQCSLWRRADGMIWVSGLAARSASRI